MKQRFTPVKIRLYAILLVHALIIATFVLMLLGNICPAELVSGTVEEPIVAVGVCFSCLHIRKHCLPIFQNKTNILFVLNDFD